MPQTKATSLWIRRSLFAICVLFTSCASHKQNEHTVAGVSAPYVRVVNSDSNLIQLQIAVREFIPSRGHGPVIWLTGVSHIGDSTYYAALQEHLNAQTLVLFEGISAGETRPGTKHRAEATTKAEVSEPETRPSSDVGGLQSALASSLGLVFQLTAINYERTNFRNCDLSIPELRQLLTEGAAFTGSSSGAGESFEGVLQLMQGGSFFDSMLQVALRFLGASPKLRALGRLALIDIIGEIRGDFSRLQGLPPELKQLLEVLLERRNQKVVTELKDDLAHLGRHDSIAVFYGTGHMPDLGKRLEQQLGYRPAQQHWFTAFSVNLAQAGVTESEQQLVQTLIRQQLAQFQTK